MPLPSTLPFTLSENDAFPYGFPFILGTQGPRTGLAATLAELSAAVSGAQQQTGTLTTAVKKTVASFIAHRQIAGDLASTGKKPVASFAGYMCPSGAVAADTKIVAASFEGLAPQGTITATVTATGRPVIAAFTGALLPSGVITGRGNRPAAVFSGFMRAAGYMSGRIGRLSAFIITGVAYPTDWVVETVETGELSDLQLLNRQLLQGSPVERAEAAHQLGEWRSRVDKEFVVTVYDQLWRPIREVGDDLIELTGSDPRNNLPTGTLKLKGNSDLIDTMMGCKDTMVGVTVETAGLRFAYYVDTFDFEFQDSEWVGTANLNGIWDILNYLVIWPNFLLPIQAQIPSHAVFIWALCTVIEVMVSECALRIQTGLWEFVNNALSLNPDVRAWFGTVLQSNGNIFSMLKCPIYVVHTNPLLDTSPLVAKTVRMESCGTVIRDITRAYGVDVRVDLWLPGDEQPDYWTQTFPAFLGLNQPTYVVRVVDRAQVAGPTGTVLDSAIGTVVDLGGSFFGEIGPIIRQVPGMDGVFYSPVLGQHYVPPWAILVAPDPVAGERGNIVSCKISDHTPKGWQHIIGGRSPKWLNDLLNATFAWIIDSVAILIGLTGIPSSLLEGFVNDAFLAFQLVENYSRRNAVGPYHPAIEVMHATSSSPYNIETLFAFINAMWDSRGYTSAVVMIRNGESGYTLGKDIFRGGLVSLLYRSRTRLYTDYVENVTFRLTEDARDLMIQIGDGKAKEAPLAKHQRFLTGVLESINVLTLSPQSAGLI